MVLETESIWKKLELIEKTASEARQGKTFSIPALAARDTLVFLPGELPPKKGLSYKEGQARLLHDLASIELQAMELALRSLIEYPQAPSGFLDELYAVTLSEASHLQLCLDAINALGYQWGQWPVHLALWKTVVPEDSLLDRILIVHRYLEGSGLDAGDTFLRKLESIGESPIHKVVKTIVTEEIGHVEFGSRWYREICRQEKIDPVDDFPQRMGKIRHRIPKRVERVSVELRQRAGFTDLEIEYLQTMRNSIVNAAV